MIQMLKPDWSAIDTVLLDLDGTLLDLRFDNQFWREEVPARYAAAHAITLEAARAELTPRFRACEGRLEWYCLEHWSRELHLDIVALKRAYADRVAWLPGAEDFLLKIRKRGKRLVMLTNAHPQALHIKDERTQVTQYFDAVFSSHTFGAPKEEPQFWRAVHEVEPFEHARSLFIDDSLNVLRAAKKAQIRWIYAVRRPESARAEGTHEEFPMVDSVAELL